MITIDIIKKAQSLEEAIKNREKAEIGFAFMSGYDAGCRDTIRQKDKEEASNAGKTLVTYKNTYY